MVALNLSPTEFAAQAGEAARLLKTLGHQARLMVLCQLVEGERSAGALQRGSGLSQSALSQHLAKLREEGLVAKERADIPAVDVLVSAGQPFVDLVVTLLHAHQDFGFMFER